MTRSELEEELSYIRRSLEDLEREHAAGDVSEADFGRLSARYLRQLARAESALSGYPEPSKEAEADSGSEARQRRGGRWRRLLSTRRARLVTGWSALVSFSCAAIVLAMALAGLGPFAPSPPLGKNAQVQILLAYAEVLGSKGDVTEALAYYDRVLEISPSQPEALADGGYLARLAGIDQHDGALVRTGDAEIQAAVLADPGYAQARAYDGVVLLEDRHEPGPAVEQFAAMLSDKPSATLLSSIRSYAVEAYHETGESVPRAIADAKSSGSTKGD